MADFGEGNGAGDDMSDNMSEGHDEIELLEAPDDGDAPKENVERVTTRYMTKYEKARVLGTRALQIR